MEGVIIIQKWSLTWIRVKSDRAQYDMENEINVGQLSGTLFIQARCWGQYRNNWLYSHFKQLLNQNSFLEFKCLLAGIMIITFDWHHSNM